MDNKPPKDEKVKDEKDWTFIVLCGLSILAVVWELWTILNARRGDTFSAIIRQLGRDQPVIPFFSGMVNRHLWSRDADSLSAFIAGFAVGDPYWPLKDSKEI